jgi:DNA-directed RNA polymerase specialized sigma24 family protein
MPGSPTMETCSPALRRYAWSLLRNTAEANDLV